MKGEKEVKEEIEKLKRIILFPNTRVHVREQSVNMLRALEWVLQDVEDKIEKRLEDAGIRKNNGKESKAE